MGMRAKVAVANLAVINCALTVILFSMHIQSEGWIAAAEVAQAAIAVLGFPVGWLSLLGLTMNGPDEVFFTLLSVFLPLNAYVWGDMVTVFARLFKACKTRPTSGD